MPALRERSEDVPELVEHFLITRQLGAVRSSVTLEAMEVLVRYDWPGNVRELANVLERAQILAEDHLITVDDLPENLVAVPLATESCGSSPAGKAFRECHCPDNPDTETSGGPPVRLDEAERLHVLGVLRQVNRNKAQAAKTLGISRRALYRLIAKHHLEDSIPDQKAEEP